MRFKEDERKKNKREGVYGGRPIGTRGEEKVIFFLSSWLYIVVFRALKSQTGHGLGLGPKLDWT